MQLWCTHFSFLSLFYITETEYWWNPFYIFLCVLAAVLAFLAAILLVIGICCGVLSCSILSCSACAGCFACANSVNVSNDNTEHELQQVDVEPNGTYYPGDLGVVDKKEWMPPADDPPPYTE